MEIKNYLNFKKYPNKRMRFNILTYLVMFLLLFQIVNASLGIYETGDTITYTVVCLTNEGTKDTGCSGNDDDILDPDDTTAKAPTSALAEISDANFPGLWRGSYLVPASPKIGTWNVFIELTNSNGTLGATTLTFEVVDQKWATQTNVSDLNASNTNIINHGGAGDWTTATGFSTHSAADVDTTLSGTHGAGSWVGIINETGASCVTVDDKTGYTIINPGNNTGAVCVAVEDKTGYTLSVQDWETETDASTRDTNANLTRTQIIDSFLADATIGLANLKTLIDAISALVDNVDSGGLKTVYDYLVSPIKVDLDSISKGIDDNRSALETHGDASWDTAIGFSTDVEIDRMINVSRGIENETREQIITDIASVTGASATEVDLMINVSRGIENETREQIITHGDATWTTGTGNTTGAVCVAVEDKTGYSLTTEDWTTSNDLNTSLAAQSEIDNETLADIKVEIEDMNGTTLMNMMQRIEDINDTTLEEIKIEIEIIEENVTDMSNYMHEEGVTGFFYKLLKTVFPWLGAGESLEERLSTQDNITKLQGELQGINDNISSMNDTTLLEMKKEIEAIEIDLSGIGANVSSMNSTTLLEMKQEIEALNVSVSTAVNATLISECVWGLVNEDVCGIWRTIHSWV